MACEREIEPTIRSVAVPLRGSNCRLIAITSASGSRFKAMRGMVKPIRSRGRLPTETLIHHRQSFSLSQETRDE